MLETCVIYLRLSLARDGDTAGIRRQERECRELCERNGWVVTHVYIDNDTSATSGVERPAFEELLQSNPERIVVWHLDRLLRLSSDLEKVLALDCNVYTVTSGDMDLSNPAGRAVARTVTAWAQYEGEQKAARQKASHRQRREEGRPWWTRRPFGYEKDGSLREDEAKALRGAYRAILDGATLMGAARDLNRKGFTTTVGNEWKGAGLRAVLLSPRNIAMTTDRGIEVARGNWGPLIDEETFRRVARMLGDPKRKSVRDPRNKGLLTGILWCGVCGSRMGVGKVAKYDYYICREGRCTSWTRRWIEDFLEERALLTLQQPQFEVAWQSPEKGMDTAAEIERLNKLLDEFLEDRLEGRLTASQWQRATEGARERLRLLEEQPDPSGEALRPKKELLDAAEKAKQWDRLSIAAKRSVIGAIFPKVVLKPYGRWGKPSLDLISYPEA